MPKNILGIKLKKLRKEKNITQTELSLQLGLSERYVSKIESGVKPSMETFKKLAMFFNVPVEYLVSENEELTLLSTNNKDLLNAFIEVDRMSKEDQNIVLELINAFIAKKKTIRNK